MARRRTHVERLNDRHHNYANVQNSLPGSRLIRLGMQINASSKQDEDEHTYCVRCQPLCLSRIPVSALHGTLVGCNLSANRGLQT